MNAFTIHQVTISMLAIGLGFFAITLFFLQLRQRLIRQANRHERYLQRFSSVHYEENTSLIDQRLVSVRSNIRYFGMASFSLILCSCLLALS